MKTILFISFHPLIQKIKSNYHLSEIKNLGYTIYYCELGFLYNFPKAMPGIIEDTCRKYFDNMKEFRIFCESLDLREAVFIMLMHLDKMTIGVYRYLTKKKVFLAFYVTGQFETVKKISIIDFLKNPVNTTRRIVNRIGGKYIYKTGFIKKYDLVFTSGSYCIEKYSQHKQVIKVNYWDYDKVIEIANDAPLLQNRYIVFLDINLPHHHDQAMLGIKAVDAKTYYSEMNGFFTRIEKHYSAEVVIAAHPKSSYSINPYDGRKMFKNKTAELVKDCQFVVSHSSSSFVFAVVYRKPLLLVYTSHLGQVYGKILMNSMTEISIDLGCPLVNVDEVSLKKINLAVDENKYLSYKYRFLTSPETERIKTELIVTDYFRKILS